MNELTRPAFAGRTVRSSTGCGRGWSRPRRPRASSTSPTGPSTRPVGSLLLAAHRPRPGPGRVRRRGPRRRAADAGRPDQPAGAARPGRGSTRSPGSSTSTSPAGGGPSTCRSTGGCRRGFRRTVLHHLPDIATGAPRATRPWPRLAGNPKAVRAVGTACATNPLPVVVPCHRVVRSDGGDGRLPRRAGGQARPCSTWRRRREHHADRRRAAADWAAVATELDDVRQRA